MERRKILRHLLGYTTGVSLFFGVIPWLLYLLSVKFDHPIGAGIIANESLRIIVSALFLLPGLIFVLWSNEALFVIGKGGPAEGFGVAVSPRTEKLVIRGPYRYTRNPMVFGALCCYIAFSLFLNSWAALSVLIGCIPLSIAYLKRFEEKRLERDFEDEYREYRKRVSMIIPLPPKRRGLIGAPG
jgi:protein-S-isoprenylcysteine O-methyltransferase Ste14